MRGSLLAGASTKEDDPAVHNRLIRHLRPYASAPATAFLVPLDAAQHVSQQVAPVAAFLDSSSSS